MYLPSTLAELDSNYRMRWRCLDERPRLRCSQTIPTDKTGLHEQRNTSTYRHSLDRTSWTAWTARAALLCARLSTRRRKVHGLLMLRQWWIRVTRRPFDDALSRVEAGRRVRREGALLLESGRLVEPRATGYRLLLLLVVLRVERSAALQTAEIACRIGERTSGARRSGEARGSTVAYLHRLLHAWTAWTTRTARHRLVHRCGHPNRACSHPSHRSWRPLAVESGLLVLLRRRSYAQDQICVMKIHDSQELLGTLWPTIRYCLPRCTTQWSCRRRLQNVP